MIRNSIRNDYKKYYENRFMSIKMDNNVFKQIKQFSEYKSKENSPDILIDEEDNPLTNNSMKCEAFAKQFERANTQTYSKTSIYENEANETYEKYNKSEPILTFTENITADFPENGNQIVNSTIKPLFLDSNVLKQIIKSRNTKKSQKKKCQTHLYF